MLDAWLTTSHRSCHLLILEIKSTTRFALGPLLSLLFTNYIVPAVGENKLRLFADDRNIYVVADNTTALKLNGRSACINQQMVRSLQTNSWYEQSRILYIQIMEKYLDSLTASE